MLESYVEIFSWNDAFKQKHPNQPMEQEVSNSSTVYYALTWPVYKISCMNQEKKGNYSA